MQRDDRRHRRRGSPGRLDMCTFDSEQIAHELLAYLVEHEEAQDTFEGIVEWWLLEQRIKRQTATVRKALSELMAKGLVVERKGRDGRSRYGINYRRVKEIRKLLKQGAA